MAKYHLVLNVENIPYNGTPVGNIEIDINAKDLAHAEEKAQRAADNYRVGSGSKEPITFTLTEIAS